MDKLLFGLIVAAIGMLIVFSGLVILIGLIKLLVKATDGMGKPKVRKESEPAVPSVAEQVTEEAEEETDDEETVAAIMAALSCVMAAEGSSFRVRHIRRIRC